MRTMTRAFVPASLFGLFLVACGSASSGGDAPTSAAGGTSATGAGGADASGKGGTGGTSSGVGGPTASAGGSSGAPGKGGSGTAGSASSGKGGSSSAAGGSGGSGPKGSAGTGGTGFGAGGSGGAAGAQAWMTSEDIPFAKVSVGGGQTLELVKMRVTTRVEGLRARIVVDHIYHNPYPKALEGTFYYQLPQESSVSYFGTLTGTSTTPPGFFGPTDPSGMLGLDGLAKLTPDQLAQSADSALWTGLKPARVVRAIDATIAFEDAAKQKIDPALVEQVAPNTFSARVFPIPANGFNRVIVTYEQTLPRIGDALEWRFPVPKGTVPEFELDLAASKDTIGGGTSVGTIDGVAKNESSQHLFFTKTLQGQSPGGVIAIQLSPTSPSPAADVIAGTDTGTQQSYFHARLAPSLPALENVDGSASNGVFMLDTSLSESPDRFAIDLKLLQGILEASPKLQKFKVMTFDTGARWLDAGWTTNDAAGRAATMAKLSKVLLEGATDFGAATRLFTQSPDLSGIDRADVFVLSDGAISWGDESAENLAAQTFSQTPVDTRFFAYRTGLGAENLELYSAFTRRGAIFNCLSMSSVGACSTAHQAAGAAITGVTIDAADGSGPAADDVLIAGRQATLFPGANLTLAGRVLKAGPAVAHVHATSVTGPVDIDIPIVLTPTGDLAPRAWAEIAVAQLVTAHDDKVEGLAMALSQRYGIASRIASFLMLETSAMYQKYDLPDETAKFGGQAIGAVIADTYANLLGAWSSWDRLSKVISKYDAWNHLATLEQGNVAATLTAGTPEELLLPTADLAIPMVTIDDVPASYLSTISHDGENVSPFLLESTRRRDLGQTGAAVRALSSLVENNPQNAQMERLAGYRMAGWGESAEASSLFFHVLERRPFEPQAYRDLANSLGVARPRLSALLYEGVVAGSWAQKYSMLVPVVKEEYSLFVDHVTAAQPSHPLVPYLQERKSKLGLVSPTGDLRVTITWNTDATDIDLWVIDPNGEKCFYGNKQLASGGKLLADLTQGYGPERFAATKAIPGTYQVLVNYYANHSNALYAFTYVNVTIQTRLGTPEEETRNYVVPLKNEHDTLLVSEETFK